MCRNRSGTRLAMMRMTSTREAMNTSRNVVNTTRARRRMGEAGVGEGAAFMERMKDEG